MELFKMDGIEVGKCFTLHLKVAPFNFTALH